MEGTAGYTMTDRPFASRMFAVIVESAGAAYVMLPRDQKARGDT
jgi:hypothetical protein